MSVRSLVEIMEEMRGHHKKISDASQALARAGWQGRVRLQRSFFLQPEHWGLAD
jgi:hypothetical protein